LLLFFSDLRALAKVIFREKFNENSELCTVVKVNSPGSKCVFFSTLRLCDRVSARGECKSAVKTLKNDPKSISVRSDER
jgi:hypothetical protein